jgi:putative membrane protein
LRQEPRRTHSAAGRARRFYAAKKEPIFCAAKKDELFCAAKKDELFCAAKKDELFCALKTAWQMPLLYGIVDNAKLGTPALCLAPWYILRKKVCAMYYIKIFLKGLVYGLANVLPGVSSGTTLLIMKLFSPMIHAINNVWKEPKKNIPFLAALFSGSIAGAVGFSNFITLFLDKFPLATSLFFCGLIFGSIPLIYRKANKNRIRKRYFIPAVLCFLGIISVSLFTGLGSTAIVTSMSLKTFVWLFFASAASSAAMVLPGSSSAIVMLMFGAYHTSVAANANIVHFADFASFTSAAVILVPILLGMLIGMVLISKIVAWLLHNHYSLTYFSMLGLMLGSVFTLMNNRSIYSPSLTIIEIIASAILFFIGGFLACWFSSRDASSRKTPAPVADNLNK